MAKWHRLEGAGRAALPGILKGASPFAIVLFVRLSGHGCPGPACWSLCLPACLAGGAARGALIATFAVGSPRRRHFVLAAGTVAALTGSMACGLFGLAGVLGMLAGLVLISTPLVLVASRR